MTDSRTNTGLLAVIATLVLLAPAAAGAQTSAEAEREALREQRAAVESELDLLAASDAEIHAALDDLDDAIAAQEQALADARDAADEAEAAVARAEADLRRARRDVAALERAIAEMAVASYIHPPTADLVQSLQASSLSDALLRHTYLDARARRDLRLLDLLEVAEGRADERAREVEEAAATAARALAAAEVALADLHQEQARQMAFATGLQQRIDASLAEAAVLAELDAELADRIEAEQAALLARIPPTPAPEAVAVDVPSTVPSRSSAPSPAPPVDDPPDADDVDPTPEAPSTPRPTHDRTEVPPLATVRGITVHADLAADLADMLDAAAADGIELSGWGYRSTQRQIELRIAHCGPTDYDIWVRPAGSCRPPTAIPGRSLHEQGRAVDFTADGRAITSRSTPEFRWLADHAATYGLFNLPSEPWHWSTTGS